MMISSSQIFGSSRNQLKPKFLESSEQELSENIIFVDFGQVFQTLWQYNCNLTIYWHGFLPNTVTPHDSG